MGTLVALVGWPGIEPPPGAWTGRGPSDLPIVLVAVPGRGGPVHSAISHDGRTAAMVAGSIANRHELEAALGTSLTAESRGDAALVVRLYESRGEQAVSALRGEFALALWDGRRPRLVLARDQLGAMPLYHAAERGRVAAAASLPPLLALPDLAGSPDVAALDILLALGTVPAPATLYPGIRQLCPGELLVWEPGRQRTVRYWQIRFPDARAERRIVSREGARRAREHLEDALRMRTAGAVAGVLLSGGLDATALLALLHATQRPLACTATVGVAEAGDADVRRAAAMARRVGVEHVVVEPRVDWPAALEASLAAHGGPLGSIEEPLLATAVDALAARSRIVLAGAGGDDVLGGGVAERAWAACARYRALPSLMREAVDVAGATGWAPGVAWIVRAARSAPIDVHLDVEGMLGTEQRLRLYTPEMRRVAEAGPARSLLVALFSQAVAAGAADPRDLLYAVRLAIGLPRAAARMRGAASAEVVLRLPFADPRLAQLAATVPAPVRAGPRERQLLLQGAVADLLPRQVRRRSHRPLAPPREAWEQGGLAMVLEETLAPARVDALGLFDVEVVGRLVAEQRAGRADHGALLWTLASASRWLERPLGGADVYSSPPAATSAAIPSSS